MIAKIARGEYLEPGFGAPERVAPKTEYGNFLVLSVIGVSNSSRIHHHFIAEWRCSAYWCEQYSGNFH